MLLSLFIIALLVSNGNGSENVTTDNRERRMEHRQRVREIWLVLSAQMRRRGCRQRNICSNLTLELFYVFCFVVAAQLVIILTTVEAGWDHKKLCKKLSLHIDLLSTQGTCAVLSHLPSQRLVGFRAHVPRLPSVPPCCSSCHLMLIHLKCQFVRSNRLSQRFNCTPHLPISSPPS